MFDRFAFAPFAGRLRVVLVAAMVALCMGPANAQQAAARDAGAPEFRLLMIEQVGCYVCAAFNRDIAPAYANAPEGQVAPLVHADLRGPLPEGVVLASRPFVTPTFILIGADGRELDRLIGFPGEDFFWPYLNEMFDRARLRIAGQ